MGRLGRLQPREGVIVTLGVLIAVVLAMAGGAAYAYFTAHGSGTGAASAGTLQGVTVAAATGTPTGALVPGGTSTDVILGVANPNSQPVTLVSVSANGAVTADTGHPGCTTTGVSFVNQTGLNITIPANQTDYQIDLAAAASMSTASVSACQGATFSIPLAITVHQG